MRFIKRLILPIIVLLLVIQTPISGYCQVGAVGKTAVKGVAKKTAKSAVKTEIKTTTKQAVKKGVVKSSTKIAKSEAKSLAKNAIKKEVQISIEKGTSKTAREATEAVLKREARETASESLVTTTMKKAEKKALKKGENVVAKRGIKTTAKSSATKTITKASTQESKAIMNSAVKAEIKSISKVSGVRVAQKVSTKEISMNVATESVEKALNKTAANRWESLVKADPHTTEILLKDLETNPQLVKHFKQNPAYLDAYFRNIGSPTYRTDINILRYQTNGANKYSDVLKCSGNDIKIIEENGINYIKDVNSNEVLGTISGTKDKRIIHTSGDENNLCKIYDLFPLGNTTYVHDYVYDNGYQKIIRKMDRQGILEECTIHCKNIPPNVTKDRDKKIRKIKEIKNDYNVMGMKSSKNHNLDDEAGHIVPKSIGGSDNAQNIFPQNRSMNRSGVWRDSEIAAKKALDDGKDLEITIYFTKDNVDKGSLRPSSVHRIHKINGEVTFDAIIDNPKVMKTK